MSDLSTTLSSSGGPPIPIPITPETDPKILFDLLDSSNGSIVQELKDTIQEIIYSVRDPWIVNGLFDYYLGSGSERCMDILLGISKEPHDKFLIEKILECIRNQPTRRSGMTFLGHLVNKQPSWLYKITYSHHNLLKEVLRILKSETDIVILMSGLLIITTLLPIIPVQMTVEHTEIFGIFEQLATWAHTSTNVPEEHLLHLQVGLYSLFHRLYALYPCNFFSFLRLRFGNSEKRVPMEVFENTIKPMLETVKLHPKLITGSREGELLPSRWRNQEYHDIIAECSLISLDVLESGVPEEINPIQLSTNTTPGTSQTRPKFAPVIINPPQPQDLHFPVSQLIQNSVKFELTDLSHVTNDDSSAPPTPLSTISVTNTPSTGTKSVVSLTETAMEATPENTPIATPVKDRHPTTHFKLPAPNSPAVMHLAFGKPPQTPPVTPFSSVPSSPAPHTADRDKEGGAGTGGIGQPPQPGTSLYRRDSIFDTNTFTGRRESLFVQKLQKLVDEQRLKEKAEKEDTVASSAASTQKKPFTMDSTHGLGFDIDSGLLQPPVISTSDQENDDSLEENDEVKGEPVPMPDKKSMIAFAQRVRRLRFYSQCGEQSAAASVSPGSSPSSSFLTNVHTRVKRSTSCPDVLKKAAIVITEESVPESTSGEEGSPTAPATSTGTSTVETDSQSQSTIVEPHTPVQPYEHLFEGVLPYFMQHPGEATTQFQSPHSILDLCIQKAAACHESSKGGDELGMLRNQIGLLHAQLLFERNRREAHALRNRSLAKRCRTAQQQEDKNYGLNSQLHGLEKEVSMLRSEINLQRTKSIEKEKELQTIILALETKLKAVKLDLENITEVKSSLESRNCEQIIELQKLNKEIEQKNSYIFQLESDLAHTSRYVDTNSQIKAAYENLQKEFLLLGELYQKQQERLNSYDNNLYLADEMEHMRMTYENELKNLKNIADSKVSAAEAAIGFIQSLEQQLNKKDAIINDQKRLVQEAGVEYTAQVKVLEEKYDCIKKINSRLEIEILNLQHQLAMKSSAASRASIVHRRISPSNGDSPHNSNNSDVDSAASAGGFQLSPEQFIFGSPQFGSGSVEMNDLQRVVEGEEQRDRERSSSSSRPVPGPGTAGGLGRSVSHPQGSVPRSSNINNSNWQ